MTKSPFSVSVMGGGSRCHRNNVPRPLCPYTIGMSFPIGLFMAIRVYLLSWLYGTRLSHSAIEVLLVYRLADLQRSGFSVVSVGSES